MALRLMGKMPMLLERAGTLALRGHDTALRRNRKGQAEGGKDSSHPRDTAVESWHRLMMGVNDL